MCHVFHVFHVPAVINLLNDALRCHQGDEFYGNNGVCLALQIHDPYSTAWEYSTFLFCGLNFFAFIFIT